MQDTRNFQASGESESTHEFEVDGEWRECDSMVIGDLSEYSTGEADMFNLCDNPSFGRQVTFYLFDDTVMECDYSDERFFKIK